MTQIRYRCWLIAALSLFTACVSAPTAMPTLASATVVSDFGTYELKRIAVVPLAGLALDGGLDMVLQSSLAAEFQAASDIEWVTLRSEELVGIKGFEPHQSGRYSAESILTLAQRHRLDGLLVVTVTDRQSHPPQRLGLQAVLLSTETGLSLWQAQVQVDAADGRTRRAAETWAESRGGDLSDDHWELVLLSPRRFVILAAAQLAAVF